MRTTLALHHVGEVVLRGLLAGLAARNRLDAVPCALHPDCSLDRVLKAEHITPPHSFSVNAKLAPASLSGKIVRFDGAHGVDVLCHNGSRGIPIEAKLGFDGLTASAFTERFLGPLALSTHKPPRFAGSMSAILNYRGLGGGAPMQLHTTDPPIELAPTWFLVIRRQTWDGWASKKPPLSDAHVMLFEEIAAKYGSPADFDQLVLEQVGDGFHSEWEIFP